MTKSARTPCTPASWHSRATWSCTASGQTPACKTWSRAAATCRANAACACACRAIKAAGSASNAIRVRTMDWRVAGSAMLPSRTHSPNRSSNCGRSGPSSGFIVPTSVMRAGCWWEIPSRSTRLIPLAHTSSSTSTNASSSRFTSSTYSTPPCACASSPGRHCTRLSRKAACKSSVPTNCSSVVPSGKFTKRGNDSAASAVTVSAVTASSAKAMAS